MSVSSFVFIKWTKNFEDIKTVTFSVLVLNQLKLLY